ncbi:MAG: ASCH domain-containing protein [Planctomycetota bacterium]|nr:ASCH domain-containing protein [Planctomycetota bacterium]
MHPNPAQIALAVQHPWAELIVRGVKTLEIRSTNAKFRGPIYIYASRKQSDLPDAALAAARFGIDVSSLPTGVILGEAELTESRPALPDDATAACVRPDLLMNRFAWRFERPNRFEEPLPVRFLPYGIWFYPFGRKTELEKNC